MRRSENKQPLFHSGLDMLARVGSKVYAAQDGEVTIAGPSGKKIGTRVRIDGGGLGTLYGHLSKVSVKLHQMVHAGDLIGETGDTGNANGLSVAEQHLHFGVMQHGAWQDPTGYMMYPTPQPQSGDFGVGTSDNTVTDDQPYVPPAEDYTPPDIDINDNLPSPDVDWDGSGPAVDASDCC